MERNFYTDDFEELLKEKADQYKMYPSDKVWNGIQNSLHSKRKWYWIGFALLLSGVSYYAIEALIAPPKAAQKSQAKVIASKVPTDNVLLSGKDGKAGSALVIPLTPNAGPRYQSLSSTIDQPFDGDFDIDRSYADIEPGATARVVEMLQVNRVPVLSGPVESKTPLNSLAAASPAKSFYSLDGYDPVIIVDNTPSSATSAAGLPDQNTSGGLQDKNGIIALGQNRGIDGST